MYKKLLADNRAVMLLSSVESVSVSATADTEVKSVGETELEA